MSTFISGTDKAQAHVTEAHPLGGQFTLPIFSDNSDKQLSFSSQAELFFEQNSRKVKI